MAVLGWLAVLLWLSSQDGSSAARTGGWLPALVGWIMGAQAGALPQADRCLRMLAHLGIVLGKPPTAASGGGREAACQ